MILNLFFLLILFILIFDRATRHYLNPYKLIFIFGKKGSGKTTQLTKIAIQHLKKGWTVYSTVVIPGTIHFDVEDVGFKTFEPHSVVLIDEVGMIWDNRDFKKFKPEVRDYFKFQRQYKNKVYLFSQTFDIDLKLRNLTDEMYLIYNFARVFSVQRRILKHITISNSSENGSGVSTLVDEFKFDSILFGGLGFTFIPRWVVYFQSFNPKKLEIAEGEYISFNDIQSEYLSTKKWILSNIKIMFIKLVKRIKKRLRKLKRNLRNRHAKR